MSKKSKTNLTKKVLELFRSGSPLTWSESISRYYTAPTPKEISRQQFDRTVNRMKKQGWLEQKKIEDKIYYRLTKQGRLQQKIYNTKKARKVRDTHATIIMFDIPEAKSNSRHFLRRFLLQNKFTLLQKSVFISPYKLTSDFFDVLKFMDLMEYITIIKGQIYYRQN